MFASPANLGFPRKVVACYLLVTMVVLSWLGVSMVLISHQLANSQSADSRLGSLGRTAAAIELSYLRHGDREFQKLIEQARAQASINYATIVGADGTVLAHTVEDQIGQPAVHQRGRLLRWGSVTGVRFKDDRGRILQEYEVPLIVETRQIGSLKIAFAESTLFSSFAKVAKYAPLAIVIPLVLVLLGARALSKMTDSLNDIQSQLHDFAKSAPTAKISPRRIAPSSGVVLGWNRLVDGFNSPGQQGQTADIHDRLQEVAANRGRNEMTEVLQNLSDGIVVTDVEGKITFANRAITALLDADHDPQVLEGSSLVDRLLEKMPDLAECPLVDADNANRLVVSEGRSEQGENQRVMRVSRQPVMGDSRKTLLWSLRDVTQQKLADEMRDQFIDTATHELRTPLSNIKAYAEMLATSDRIELERQKEFCNIINSEVTRLARFVDDLLSISSMEVGSLSAEKQKVETTRLFEEVLVKVQPLMEKKDIQFEVRLPEKMRDLVLDKEKIVAVLVNLLGNAAKYTPNGGHVAMKVKLEDGLLEVAVEDTGFGISEEELPQVFDKFFRSADSRIQDEVGTGLGLSLAREVVRMHGGEITVESTLNKGSTFLVTIPLE